MINRCLFIIALFSFILMLFIPLFAQPFSNGEKIDYKIYASGFYVGHQIIEVVGDDIISGKDVWIVKARSKTSPFLSIFYRLDDKWVVYMDKKNFLPLRVEKNVLEGKRKGYLIYNINQDKKKLKIMNKAGKKIKEISYKNELFDLFSLIYYFRANPEKFKSDFKFDFLEEKSVRTVSFKKDKKLNVIIPRISRRKPVEVLSITQIGGIGINIMVSWDKMKLPLKMVVPSRLPGNKRINVIFSIYRFTPGINHSKIPSFYHSIIK